MKNHWITRNCCMRLCALWMLASLSACSSTNTAPEKNYYVLQQSAGSAARAVNVSGAPEIAIGRITLPSYLNQQGIARLLPNGQVNVSYTDLWGEKLSQAIPALLAEQLALQLQAPVEVYPLPAGVHVKTTVEVNISHFIGDENNLHLKGRYRHIRGNQLNSYSFAKHIPLDNHQTSTLVAAYAEAIAQLSQTIAKQMKKPAP